MWDERDFRVCGGDLVELRKNMDLGKNKKGKK